MAGSPDTLFFLRLWTAAHRAERLVAREFEADGIAGRQLALLLLVELHEPATPTTLAAALGVPFMTASDALQRLVADGDVEHEPNPADRRSHLYALTDAGRARLRAVEAPLRRAVASVRGATDSDAGDLAAAVAELDLPPTRAARSGSRGAGSICCASTRRTARSWRRSTSALPG